MFFPFLFSFLLSQWFVLSTSHTQNNHHSRMVRTMNKVFAHREPRGSTKRLAHHVHEVHIAWLICSLEMATATKCQRFCIIGRSMHNQWRDWSIFPASFFKPLMMSSFCLMMILFWSIRALNPDPIIWSVAFKERSVPGLIQAVPASCIAKFDISCDISIRIWSSVISSEKRILPSCLDPSAGAGSLSCCRERARFCCRSLASSFPSIFRAYAPHSGHTFSPTDSFSILQYWFGQ